MKRMIIRILATSLITFACSLTCFSQPSLPAPQGMVSDFAGKLDSQTRAQLERLLRDFRDKTQIEVAVVTVNYDDMQGYPIEQYALELGRKWGVGRDSQKRALLLLVAIKPRGSDGKYHGGTRLEVSRKLEGDIPDILAGEVIRKMRDDFQAGRFDQALVNGTQTILATLQQRLGISVDGVDPAQVARRSPRGVQSYRQPPENRGFFHFLLVVIIVGIVVAVIVAVTRGGKGGPGAGRRRRSSWGSPDWIIWPMILGGWGNGRRGSTWGGGWGSGGSGWGGGGGSGGGFGGFGGGGDFGGGGASDSW
jgi:uncharacterized protein